MTGDDVLALQQQLYELGYLEAAPDGIFGNYTEAAANAFQLANGLGYSDGIAGDWTKGKLANNPVVNKKAADSLAGDPESFRADTPLILTRTLKKGMTGEDVNNLQKKLYALGYLTVVPDGIFGNYTEAAVNEFQRANGLAYPDGMAGKWTMSKMNSSPAEVKVFSLSDLKDANIFEIGSIPAGTVISEKVVSELGMEQFFYVEEISDDTFLRMSGKSFGTDCTVPRSQLRYIGVFTGTWQDT